MYLSSNGHIGNYLRERALINAKEDDAIDYALVECKKSLSAIAEQFGSARAKKLSALMERADEAAGRINESIQLRPDANASITEALAKVANGETDACAKEFLTERLSLDEENLDRLYGKLVEFINDGRLNLHEMTDDELSATADVFVQEYGV